MSYITELEKALPSNFSDTITKRPNEDTVICINIAGDNIQDLEDALDCIYFDDRRKFKLVEVKKQPFFISALVLMENKEIKPIHFFKPKTT